VDHMIDRLMFLLPQAALKSVLIQEFLLMLRSFEESDSEEREEACTYCQRVMEIVGVKSSDGALNRWLYGFDPDQKG
jgi:hypothetical protein